MLIETGLQELNASRLQGVPHGLRPRTLARRYGVLFEGDRLPLAGLSVFEAKALLTDAWNVPYFADAIVNGHSVLLCHVLQHGDRLGFSQRFGVKAVDDLAAEKAMAETLLRSEPELARLVDEVHELRLSVDQRLAVMALRVVQWYENRFGPVTADAVAVLNKMASEWNRLARGGQTPATSRPEGSPISERVRVDVAAGKVIIDGVHHALDRVYLAILECLVAADGEVVSRAEMKERSDTLKEEDHIERHINRLKKMNGAVGRLIETDKRHRGFRIRRDF